MSRPELLSQRRTVLIRIRRRKIVPEPRTPAGAAGAVTGFLSPAMKNIYYPRVVNPNVVLRELPGRREVCVPPRLIFRFLAVRENSNDYRPSIIFYYNMYYIIRL